MIFENIIYQDYLSEIENEWKVHFENALLGQVISEVAAAYRMILEKSFQNPCKVLQLPTDFHSYLYNGIPSLKLRKNVWNYIRRIEREASVNYFIADDQDFEHYWGELISLHCENMKLRGKGSPLAFEEFPHHLKTVSKAYLEKNQLFLCVMKVNDISKAKSMAENAHNMLEHSFSLGKWRTRITESLTEAGIFNKNSQNSNTVSNVLQVSVHPICIGSLRDILLNLKTDFLDSPVSLKNDKSPAIY
jgi:hypothetical protein